MLLRAAAAASPLAALAPGTLGYGLRYATTAASTCSGKVGFVGLGAMGLRMAKHLLAAGHNLLVYDSNHLAVESLLEEAAAVRTGSETSSSCSFSHLPGGRWGIAEALRSPAEIAETPGVGVVFTMLSGPDAARRVYLGSKGLLAPQGGIVPRVLVDCTTLDPPTARELAGRVRAAAVNVDKAGAPLQGLPAQSPTLLDAPVTGGIVGADAGTLSFLVGGDEAALPAVEHLLRAMGTSVTWCGDPGDAQAARLCNTMVQAATMAATAEALALARRLGVDPRVMTKVLNSGSGRSWVSQEYNPVPGITPQAPSSRGYRGGLRCTQVADHLKMAVTAAEKSYSPVPMARQVMQLYGQVCEEGLGDLDFASVYRYVYGSGAAHHEWASGEALFNAQHP
ncbi:hypothetical protein Agub_g5495 [Astrephomene gubernaculifera]|uniref:3-hydroxyisobutyrate dehydrogenase n=1 Tax=Astrephomene gubernaculifera TaxID=47775 RepID=A0AAD3HKT8_9CHLO|nr:hypothetical protein Agub_g5495 [Astrephomene gubernaculifera]